MIPIYKILNEGIIVSHNYSLTICLELSLPTHSSLLDRDIVSSENNESGREIYTHYLRAFKILPIGYIVHQQDVLYPCSITPNNADGHLAAYQRFHYSDKQKLTNRTFFFITRPKSSMITSENKVSEFVDVCNQFKAILSNIFINPQEKKENIKTLSRDEIATYVTEYFSVFTPTFKEFDYVNARAGELAILGYSIQSPESILASSLPFKKSTNYYSFPLYWGIDFPHIINNIFVMEDAVQAQSTLEEYRRKITYFKSLYPDLIKPLDEFIERLETGNNKYVLHHWNAFFFSSPEEQKYLKSQLSSTFSLIDINPTEISTSFQRFFENSCGGGAERFKHPYELYGIFLEEVIALLNIGGDYEQSKKGIYLADINGLPLFKDLFHAPMKHHVITNRNGFISGKSGTGKSCFMNNLLSNVIENDDIAFVIDIGDSYNNLCKLHGDKALYMKFDVDNIHSIALNPFNLRFLDPVDSEHLGYFSDQMDKICELLFLCWETVGIGEELNISKRTPESISQLNNLLKDFYSHRFKNGIKEVNFNSFYTFIKGLKETDSLSDNLQKYFDVNSFLLVMEKYTIGNAYGNLMNGDKSFFNIKGKKLIVCEMKQAESKGSFFLIMMAVVIMMSKDMLYSSSLLNPKQLKFLVIDEGWKFLGANRNIAEFIFGLFKTIRKEQGGAWIIVQENGDIARNTYGAGMLNNSDIKVFLSAQDGSGDLRQHQQALGLSNSEVEKIISLRKDKHELFIKLGNTFGIYRNTLTPEQLCVFASEQPDREKFLAAFKNNNGNIPLTIENVINLKK